MTAPPSPEKDGETASKYPALTKLRNQMHKERTNKDRKTAKAAKLDVLDSDEAECDSAPPVEKKRRNELREKKGQKKGSEDDTDYENSDTSEDGKPAAAISPKRKNPTRNTEGSDDDISEDGKPAAAISPKRKNPTRNNQSSDDDISKDGKPAAVETPKKKSNSQHQRRNRGWGVTC